MLQEDLNSRLNYQQERSSGVDHNSQIHKNWSPTKNFSNNGSEDLSITSFKSLNQDFPLVDTVISTSSAGFPVGSVSYGYPSTLVQSLFDSDSQSQQSLFNNNRSIMSYSSTANNYGTNSNELSPSSWTKFSAPFYPKQQPCGLHFSNKTPFWNASTEALTDNNIRPGLHPSSQSQYLVPTFEEKPKCSNLPTKVFKY